MSRAVLVVLALSSGLISADPLATRSADYGRLPLTFEINSGQFDSRVRFLARARGHSIFITRDEVTVAMHQGNRSAAVSFQLSGALPSAVPVAESPLNTYSNYFEGNDPSKWIRGVRHFGTVRVPGVRPGIDLVYRGDQGQFEYDLEVAAGSDTSGMVLHVEGAESLSVDGNGDLLIHTVAGDLRQHAPVAWQEVAGERHPVSVRYALRGRRDVLFQIGGYDRRQALTIDPVVTYSTYLGGSGGDQVSAIAVDSLGNAYVTGTTNSTDFPVTSGSYGGDGDAFVAKINPAGTALVYATYVGGSSQDTGNAIAIDGSGNAYITGYTYSSNFPVVFGGTSTFVAGQDAFVTKVNSSGVIVASRFICGNGSAGSGIAVDFNGDPYVVGFTSSATFPVTTGSLITVKPSTGSNSGFVAKLDTSLNVTYGTYLGGSGSDSAAAVAVSSTFQAYIVGTTNSTNFPTTSNVYQTSSQGEGDAFVAELNAAGTALVYSTYLGGSSADQANAIALDSSGNAYVTGTTESTNFPTTNGAFLTSKPTDATYLYNVFVTKVDPGGATLGYSTFLGGNSYYSDASTGIAADSTGNAYVVGSTSATNFPTTPGALFDSSQSFFLSELNAAGDSVVYSTYFGGSSGGTAGGIALDGNGNAYVVGATSSEIFPTTAAALQLVPKGSGNGTSGIVMKIDLSSSSVCNIVLSSSSISLPGIGGTGSFTFTVNSGCPWEIASPASFVTVQSPLAGFGNGTVNYTAALNQYTYSGQTATITVNGGALTAGANVFTVNEAAGSCTAPVFGTSMVNIAGAGGIHDVSVGLPSNCAWNVSNNLPWITLSNSVDSEGSGTLSIYAAPNSYSQRQGTITLATMPISIVQTGGSCSLSLTSHETSVAAQITGGAVSFTTGGTCAWAAYSNVSWIQVNSNSTSGQGNGSVSFVVAGNPGTAARTGSLLIGDQTYQVMQAGGPGVNITSYTQSLYTSSGCCGAYGDGGPVGSASVFDPSEMAFDRTGNFYIADTADGRIRVVNTSGIINTFAGGGSSGLGDGGPPTSATLSSPEGVAVDSSGNVYIADTGNNRIRKVAGNVISTIAGTGFAGYNGDNQAAINAQIYNPNGIVVDSLGNVYFTDAGNQRIRRISSGGIISTIAGTGSAGFSGDGGFATAAILSDPTSLAIDSVGNLYFIDYQNGRVREISTAGLITTVAGNGMGYPISGDGGPATSASLYFAGGLALDASGSIYIGEWDSGVRKVTPNGIIQTISTYSNGYYVGGLAVDSFGNVYAGEYVAIYEFTPVQSFCGFTVAPPTPQSATGGILSMPITAVGSCSWSASSSASWITPVNSSGSGSGTATFSVAANSAATSRVGTIVVAGQTFNVVQSPTGVEFYPLVPCRIADTRSTQGFSGAFGPPSLATYVSRNFPILSSACNIPSTALAYSLNITVSPSGPLGFLSTWPAGQPYPGVSTLNSTNGSLIANAAIVPAGSGDAITVEASDPTDVIIDINGYFAPPGASGLDFFPLTPCRIADTRTSQDFSGSFGPPSLATYTERDFPILSSSCDPPATAQAYSLNLTVLPPGPLGFLSTWPSGEPYPGVSTLNSPTGTVLANAAIVPAGASGAIATVASNVTDLIIDINGSFGPPGSGGLKFYPATPCRIADTRSSQSFTGSFGPPSLEAYASRNFPILSGNCAVPSTAQAYAVNLTAVPQGPLAFVSAWAAGRRYPGVSTLNSTNGDIIANAAIVPAGTGGAITIMAANPTDVIVDIVGYFAP